MKIELLIDRKIENNISDFDYQNYLTCKCYRINGLENYIIGITLLKENMQCVKISFEVLQRIKDYLQSKDILFYEIKNECSLYLLRCLYPKLQNFECNLRSLLQIALCDADEILRNAYDKLNTKLGGKKQNIITKFGLINATDLQDIFEFLFVDKSILQTAKDKFTENNWNLMNEINDIKINSLWNTLLKDKFKGFELNKYCKKLYEVRNNVMHFHYIDFITYKESLLLINKLNRQLQKQLDKNIVLELSDYKDNDIIENNIFINLHHFINSYKNNGQFGKISKMLKELDGKNSEFRKLIEPLQLESLKLKEIAQELHSTEFKNYLNSIKVSPMNDIKKSLNFNLK